MLPAVPMDNNKKETALLKQLLHAMPTGALLVEILQDEKKNKTGFTYLFANTKAICILGEDPGGKKLTELYFKAPHNILFSQFTAAVTSESVSRKNISYTGNGQPKNAVSMVERSGNYLFCLLEEIPAVDNAALVLPFTATEQLLHALFDNAPAHLLICKCLRNEENTITDAAIVFTNTTIAPAFNSPALQESAGWQLILDVMDSGITSTFSNEPKDQQWFNGHPFTAIKINDHYLAVSCNPLTTEMAAHKEAISQLEGESMAQKTHAIRNPLASILLSAQMAAEHLTHHSKNSIMPFFTIISRNARKIESLLQHLLEPGKTDYRMEIRDLCDLVEIALQHAADRILLSGCRVHTSLKKGFQVAGEKEKIVFAFLDIIINAIEATETGKGELSVTIFHHPSKVTVIFKDNGRGLYHRHMNAFPAAWSERTSGQHTGLYHARHLLAQYDACIEMYSEAGSGNSVAVIFRKKLPDN